jgi:hypothetical protein
MYMMSNFLPNLFDGPIIATALSTVMEIQVPCGDDTEVGRWVKGNWRNSDDVEYSEIKNTYAGYSKMYGFSDGKVRIRFSPDAELLGSVVDIDGLRDLLKPKVVEVQE